MNRFFIITVLIYFTGCSNSPSSKEQINEDVFSNTKVPELVVEEHNVYEVGYREIKIPKLSQDLDFIDKQYEHLIELFVPPTNGLVCGYILNDEKYIFEQGSDDLLTKYAMVQFPKEYKTYDVSKEEFRILENQMKNMMSGNDLIDLTITTQDILNERFEKLEFSDFNFEIGTPVQLGTLIKKDDVFGFGMITPYQMLGNSITKVMLCMLMRVNKRILFVYIYDDYKGKSEYKEIINLGEDFADRLFMLNK